jgi:signal transduction histidine kinase
MQLLGLLYRRNSKFEFPNSASIVNPEVAYLISLVAGEKEVGILCLSPKISRQNYSSDDIFLIQGLASVAAVALRSAILVHDVSLRDTFVSIASHELRTPLTAIMGFAELLRKRNPPEETRKRWIKNIIDNGQIITDMADDLLSVSRIQTGKIGMKLEKVNISGILEKWFAFAKETTDKHELVLEKEAGLPDAVVDRDKFGQIVWNLLSNAIKYSPKGGQITLAAHKEISGRGIVVSVADHGLGIGPEDRESLFTTFHRIDRPETLGIRGIGLGLYIVKEWTEEMGGDIRLESELNKGSTFYISIPAVDNNP